MKKKKGGGGGGKGGQRKYLFIIVSAEICLFGSFHLPQTLPMLSVDLDSLHAGRLRLRLRLLFFGHDGRHGLGPVSLHLLVAVDQVVERVDIGDAQEPVPVGFDDVHDKRFDVFAADELEQLETGRVQQVVARHGFRDNVENQAEDVVMRQEGLEEGVLDTNQSTEKFQCSCFVSMPLRNRGRDGVDNILSLRCFWGTVSNWAILGARLPL